MVPVQAAKASASLNVKVKPGKVVVDRTRAKVIVTVKAAGANATGRIEVKVGGDTYKAKLEGGRAVVQLDRFAKTGKKKVKVELPRERLYGVRVGDGHDQRPSPLNRSTRGSAVRPGPAPASSLENLGESVVSLRAPRRPVVASLAGLAVALSTLAVVSSAAPRPSGQPQIWYQPGVRRRRQRGRAVHQRLRRALQPGRQPVSLHGKSLQYASATGTGNFGANAGQLTELSGTVQPSGTSWSRRRAEPDDRAPRPRSADCHVRST